ncbi:hypothetical protein DICSQDRAFT_167072 [Dichomitus squalens LYAD-421 SS1]|uniref:uncharacterized protein n=1 Tax=Dichomitus squalens (strain LYAD-421) TaxID=732165 RepID=UPI0004412291|nr:uncharacterized protein DICSQDRAFT_167072 [Dichomitus squalens LYAD-421 SS1]EJF64926.1 hypothetical protein DICSQDRAFT_167072 [Dichomitus squalens LYAD-421 SS1]
MRFPRDGPELKSWVVIVWALNTANVVLVCHGLYYWAWSLVVGTAMTGINVQHQVLAKRSVAISPGQLLMLIAKNNDQLVLCFSSIESAVVQCFFMKRIYKLCQTRLTRYTLPITMALLVLAHLVLGAQTMVKVISTFESSSLDSLEALAFSTTLPYMVLAVASDGFLAGTLTLMSRGRNPEWDKSIMTLFIHQAITLLINRCVLIAVAAIARLVMFTILPWTAWFIVADFIMGKRK